MGQNDLSAKNGLIGTGILAAGGGYLMMTICGPYAAQAIITGKLLMITGAALSTLQLSQMSKFDNVFRGANLGVNGSYPIKKRAKRFKEERYTLYEFTLPAGLEVDDFIKEQKAIEQNIGREVDIAYGYKNILIKVYEDKMKTFYPYQPFTTDNPTLLPFGYDRLSRMITADLQDGEPHLGIYAETGGGKSTLLRFIIVTIIVLGLADLYLIDLKGGVEFQLFKDCRNVHAFVTTEEEADVLLSEIIAEMKLRYHLFGQTGCNDIKAYLAKGYKMRYKYLIIDEFALIDRKASFPKLEHLAAQARSCGIHMIISTQNPYSDVINGKIKNNVGLVAGLKTASDTASRVAIGSTGLEHLRGKGHGKLKTGGQLIEFQAPFLSVQEAEEILKDYKVLRLPPAKKQKKKPEEIKWEDIFDDY